MVENLIIKTSYTKISDGQLKSNLGDLVKSPILLWCIKGDYTWFTDIRAKKILKYFIPQEKIISLEEERNPGQEICVKNIYNLDNYIYSSDFFSRIKGYWHGYLFKENSVFAQNNLIEAITPYAFNSTGKSWQELLIEGLGFQWKEQDYLEPKLKIKETVDIGFNWAVHKDWETKAWPQRYWSELEQLLSRDYSVSWQQGQDNFDNYINWMSSCRLIVTCETLGLHLASALRKKVLSIVGPAESNEFPYGRMKFIRPRPRNCMPCNSPKCKKEEICLREIKVMRVYHEIINMLNCKDFKK